VAGSTPHTKATTKSVRAEWIVDAGCIPTAAVTPLTSAAVDIDAWIGGRAAGHVDALASLALLTRPAVDIGAWIGWNASVNVQALASLALLAHSAVDVLARIDNDRRRSFGGCYGILYLWNFWNPTFTPEIREHDLQTSTPNASFAIVAYLPPTSVMFVLASVLAFVLGSKVVPSSRASPEPSTIAVLVIVVPSGLLVVASEFNGPTSARFSLGEVVEREKGISC